MKRARKPMWPLRFGLKPLALAASLALLMPSLVCAQSGVAGSAEAHVFEGLPSPELTPLNSSLLRNLARPTLDGAAARVGEVHVSVRRKPALADGRSLLPITIRLLNRHGNPLGGQATVSVQASMGLLLRSDRQDAQDLDRIAVGHQLKAVNGELTVWLRAPDVPGTSTIKVQAGDAYASLQLSFLPELRPMLAVGLAEGLVHLRQLRGGALLASRPQDDFEREMLAWQRSVGGNHLLAGRVAFFAQGAVFGNALLTASYDSDKDVRERGFRDVRYDTLYPTLGDSSLQADLAPSSGRLFMRLDQERSYLQWGDFTTASASPALQLGNLSRTGTGLRAHHETARVLVDGFASHDSLRRVVDELPGRGVSGPYFLSRKDGVQNSEQVELLTRDRNQPAVVLERKRLTRLVDYDFEPLTGRLLFKAPVPTLDEAFNPVSIRVQYEIDQGGERFWVGGLSGQWRPASFLEVGGSVVDERNPMAAYRLASANAALKLGEGTVLAAEVARSQSDEHISLGVLGQPNVADAPLGAGKAYRVELRYQGQAPAAAAAAVEAASTAQASGARGALADAFGVAAPATAPAQARIFHAHADAAFNNPGSGLAPGRTESGAKASVPIPLAQGSAHGLRLSAEALRSEDAVTGSKRSGASLSLQARVGQSVEVELGVRKSHETVTPAQASSVALAPWAPEASYFNPTGGVSFGLSAPPGSVLPGEVDQTSARIRLGWQATPRVKVFGELEQAISDASRRAAAVGGEYRFTDRGRVYARHELANSLSGAYGLNTGFKTHGTVLGLDTEYAKDAQLFSEYRLRDAGSGEAVQAAVGLRNLWALGEGWRISTSAERVQMLSGATAQQGNATALALGLDYVGSPLWKGSARLEWRHAPTVTSWLSTLALARKLNRDWTLLARNAYSRTEQSSGAGQTLERFQFGTAYRDTDTNLSNALARYEYKLEDERSLLDPLRRSAHIVSIHADRHPTRTFTVSGQAAAKRVSENLGGLRSQYSAALIGTRLLWDASDRWDLGLNASVLLGGGLRSGAQSRQFALGPEMGYLVKDNLWLSAGFNFSGFKDKDLAQSDYTSKGVYLRLRFKFDHRLWQSQDPAVNKTLVP